jgi:hypothetical protein
MLASPSNKATFPTVRFQGGLGQPCCRCFFRVQNFPGLSGRIKSISD